MAVLQLVVKLDSWSNGTDELTSYKELKLNNIDLPGPASEGNYLLPWPRISLSPQAIRSSFEPLYRRLMLNQTTP